uniref:Thioredoxin domain-containing protein n=1 Tax=viral metagenome TaxID=1070528 RepID=A0A6C0H6S7_9ZZZZ
MYEKQIITSFENRNDFFQLLPKNPGLIIIKFGATWCKPCKTIQPYLESFFATSPNEVICCDIDVDESFDLYSFMKARKMTNGIPVIMCYLKGNTNIAPNFSITGSDLTQLDNFFKRCGLELEEMKKKGVV